MLKEFEAYFFENFNIGFGIFEAYYSPRPLMSHQCFMVSFNSSWANCFFDILLVTASKPHAKMSQSQICTLGRSAMWKFKEIVVNFGQDSHSKQFDIIYVF